MPPTEPHRHPFRSPDDEAQARKYLSRAAEAALAPRILQWGHGFVVTEQGIPLDTWLKNAGSKDIDTMKPLVLDLVRQIHSLGICHRDMTTGNVLILDGRPVAIDFEHACDVDPTWPCYDLTGPSAQVPLLRAHKRLGGVLGSTGIWWDAKWDRNWSNTKPLGVVFGPLRPS
jgi:Ser/Thr protein kinase RdoA (MazF antagonist)